MKRTIISILGVLILITMFLGTAIPIAAAAPSVLSVTATSFNSSSSSTHNVQMPATVDANDLLILLFVNCGTSTVTTPSGWTQLASNSNSTDDGVRFSVYWKKAVGNEDGTTVNCVTSSNQRAAAQVYRISASSWHGTTPPEISTASTGETNHPDPSSLNPTGWGTEDTLWIAAAGIDDDVSTSYPTNYTNGEQTQGAGSGADCTLISARRANTTDSENPSYFDLSGSSSDSWVAFTIAIRPAPAGPTNPTVTINQAVGQADPTSASPINFTAVFSESVSDFATGDVTLSGTAGATTADVTPAGPGTTYNVAVSGMTGDGTVIASIADGVAHGATGLPNLASTSTDHTVTYDYVVPNPPLSRTCGLDIVLVMDESTSIDGTEFAQMQTAFTAFVNALSPATPTEFALVDFGTDDYLRQSFAQWVDAATIISYINAAKLGGTQYTNWVDALTTAQGLFPGRPNPNLIIFASDGNPNRPSESTALSAAIAAADAAKTAGTRIITIGIGNDLDADNLIAISSADAYYPAADFSTLAATLAQIASELCGGTITIHKVIDLDGNLGTDGDRITSGVPVTDWRYDLSGGSANPTYALTDGTGTTVAFDISGSPATVTITETLKAGYSFLGVSISGASGSPGSINFITHSLEGLEVNSTDIISVTFFNTPDCGPCDTYNEQTGVCDYQCTNCQHCEGGVGCVDNCAGTVASCGCESCVSCDDQDPCTIDSCVDGVCQNEEIPGCGECPDCYEKVNLTVVSDTNTQVNSDAVIAWEPDSDTDPSFWDTSIDYDFSGSGADWIWGSYRVTDPVNGEVLYFTRTVNIPSDATNITGVIHITCDNGYELRLNTNFVGDAQVHGAWQGSDLTETYVDTSGWQSVEYYDITSFLTTGDNTFEFDCANEQMAGGTIDSNPAGLIFEIEISYCVPIECPVCQMCVENNCVPDTEQNGDYCDEPGSWEDRPGYPCQEQREVYTCDNGQCVASYEYQNKENGTDCGDCSECLDGQCVSTCTKCQTCVDDACVDTCTADAGLDQTITLGGSVMIGAIPPSSCTECTYSWTPDDGSLDDPNAENPVASPTATTTYTLTVTYNDTCEVKDDVTVTVTTPGPPPGGGPGPDKCYLIIDMLGERTLVEIDCCKNTTVEECQAYDKEQANLLELKDETLVQCGDCEGCNCYPKIIVMSPSDETIEPPEGMTLVGPLYDFTGYKDIRQEMACSLATYFDPMATVLLNYDPALLPPGASEPVIGFFSHTDNQWVLLPPDTGRVAEVGTATGVTGYFASPFAVLASAPPEETPEPPPANPSPAHFVASGLSITPPEVNTGEAVTISLNVANDGEESGTYTVELKISGSTVDSKIVTLDGGQGQAVSFAVSASEAGTYDASVSGLNGSFTVVKSSMWWIYLIIAAVVILLVVMALRFRRKPSK
jgi:hypothetical protein